MTAIRYTNGNTGANCSALLGLINDNHCVEVRLFASPRIPDAEYNTQTDGLETNLPLLVAWAKYEIPKIDTVYVLFDGNFLTAARNSRYLEVREILDAAERTQKVTFATQAAPFTTTFDPKQAIDKLNTIPFTQFTTDSRAQYFSLLSSITEMDFSTLY
jgi:hypothetical protein